MAPDVSMSFNIDYDWLHGDSEDAAEGWTVAAVEINVGPYCATELEDILAKTVRRSARLSALHLAEWFASNWWRLLWEPRAVTPVTGSDADAYSWRASHRVGNAGNGYVWPDLSFSSDWQQVHVSSRPTRRWEAEPVRYLNGFDHSIPVANFERGMADFVDATVGRLSDVHGRPHRLGLLWDEVARERADRDDSTLRILEAVMGYDPDDAPSELLNDLRREMDPLGANAVQEVAAEYRQETMPRLRSLLGSARERGAVVRVPSIEHIRDLFDAEDDYSDVPWRRAERAARIAREAWNLEPPVSTPDLCDLLSIRRADLLDDHGRTSLPFLAGLRETGASENFRVSLTGKYATARRFRLTRLVADHIAADDGDTLLPGTDRQTSRQKFQRAFAQELLCPFDALMERMPTERPTAEDIDDAARHFDVSPLLVHSTLVNKGALGRETLAA